MADAAGAHAPVAPPGLAANALLSHCIQSLWISRVHGAADPDWQVDFDRAVYIVSVPAAADAADAPPAVHYVVWREGDPAIPALQEAPPLRVMPYAGTAGIRLTFMHAIRPSQPHHPDLADLVPAIAAALQGIGSKISLHLAGNAVAAPVELRVWAGDATAGPDPDAADAADDSPDAADAANAAKAAQAADANAAANHDPLAPPAPPAPLPHQMVTLHMDIHELLAMLLYSMEARAAGFSSGHGMHVRSQLSRALLGVLDNAIQAVYETLRPRLV